jgi:hypothetical protein
MCLLAYVLACSPPPPLLTLSVASAVISSAGAGNNRFTCTATITIWRAGTSTPVSGAAVSLTWSTLTSFSGYPYSTTLTTGANGVGTSTTSPSIRRGRGCRYTVTGVTAAGFAPLSVPAGSIVRTVNA